MKYFIAFIVIISAAGYAYTLPHPKEEETYRLFNDKVNVRAQPAIDGSIIANLPAGAEITVLEKTKITMDVDGFIDYWYRVKLADDSTGFVWGGFLANHSITLDIDNDHENELLLIKNVSSGVYSLHFDLDRNSLRSDTQIKDYHPLYLKCLKKRKVLFTSTAFKGFGETHISRISYHSIPGIAGSGVKFIDIEYSGEDDIGGHGKSLLYYSNNTLSEVFGIFHGGEGDSASEFRIIYPADKGGAKNTLRVIVTQYWYPGDKPTITSKHTEDYVWNSKSLKFDR